MKTLYNDVAASSDYDGWDDNGDIGCDYNCDEDNNNDITGEDGEGSGDYL